MEKLPIRSGKHTYIHTYIHIYIYIYIYGPVCNIVQFGVLVVSTPAEVYYFGAQEGGSASGLLALSHLLCGLATLSRSDCRRARPAQAQVCPFPFTLVGSPQVSRPFLALFGRPNLARSGAFLLPQLTDSYVSLFLQQHVAMQKARIATCRCRNLKVAQSG